MFIWLSLICLTVKTPTSVLHDCSALQASDSEQLANKAVAEICMFDPDPSGCLSRSAVQKLRLEVTQVPLFWERLLGGKAANE